MIISSMPKCRCEKLTAQQRCVDEDLEVEMTFKRENKGKQN